ncbi:fatty acid synthase-like isoform X2 [Cylas formicarius]|uniref:fatty acid synthase-like isoform X2 n=1 Tax=Cylas formicarius TaxID=197179 RepID=UPI00295870CF|nr:fatty acid synthase-like isoform X2 [Cylas formicarius]
MANPEDPCIKFGKLLANPDPGDEIVITGLSGKYPDSGNVHQFRDNLFNKVDMINDDGRRWETKHEEIPPRAGKLLEIADMDAGYFGIHYRQSVSMDPMVRILLEIAIEAIIDAGINPSDLEGSNTGVYVGACVSETEKFWFYTKLLSKYYAITGNVRSMLANRISYFLKLKGLSFISDTACSSSLFCFENAYKAIRMGQCDRAIVCGANLCLHPCVTLQFARLGVLSPEGYCRPFDNAGNGYVRSETISAIVLEKAKDAKRIYATVLHAKTNCDGYKDSGITFPSREMQVRLLKEIYEEYSSVKPNELSYLEAHGTGTKVGDPEELQAIEDVFLQGRKSTLLVGSVKSNIGHSEPSSGLCSITKVLLAMETGFVPPNLHYKTPRQGIKSLVDGRLTVVAEKMPFQDNRGLVGISSFGFGGGNCHILLKHNEKHVKGSTKSQDNVPILVCVSGRSKESVFALLDDVLDNKCNVEHIGLLHNVFRKNLIGHLWRGYSVMSKSRELTRSCLRISSYESRLIIAFGEISNVSNNEVTDFMRLPFFASTVQKISEFLSPLGVNIAKILANPKNSAPSDIILVNFSVQLAMADVLQELQIKPAKIVGASMGICLGTLVASYYDGAVTMKEVLECAVAISKAASQAYQNNGVEEQLGALIFKSSKISTKLSEELTQILGKPRRLSKNVIFDSGPSEISSYSIMNSLGKTKILKDVALELNRRTVLVEVGNGALLKALKKKFKHLDDEFFLDSVAGLHGLLSFVGRVYETGRNPQVQNIYPKVQFPVSRGTPMVSPKIEWLRERKWWVTRYECNLQYGVEEKMFCMSSASESMYEQMLGHVIDGRNLFPATGYLLLAWETLADIQGISTDYMKVVFEDCRFLRACTLSAEGSRLLLKVAIQVGNGLFEITENGVVMVTGRISQKQAEGLPPISFPKGVTNENAPAMTSKDIYKELKLRGYHYKGKFCGLDNCDNSRQVGEVRWEGSWVSFMDSMLQIKILQEDTRLLYVPTHIRRVFVDAKKHLDYVQTLGENPKVPVYVSKDAGLIRSGFVEVRGINASSITRRKYLGTPVLEKYVFVPNVAQLGHQEAVRVNMQVLLENLHSTKVKVVELVDEQTSPETETLGDLIYDVFADQPLIQPDIKILSDKKLDTCNVKVESGELVTHTECALVVGSKILERPKILQLALGSILDKGFVLSREPVDLDLDSYDESSVTIVTVYTTDIERLVFFRKSADFTAPTVVDVSDTSGFRWLSKLQAAVKNDDNVLVYSQNSPLNGILGLVNCIRREPGLQKVRGVFIVDEYLDFHPQHQMLKQLKKNLAMNVFKNGTWGTYRHLLVERLKATDFEHCYVNSRVRGDLSSLTWIQGTLSSKTRLSSEQVLIYVYYASLNFRDVMLASGRINVDVCTRDRREQECVLGLEASGRTADGKRVMSLVSKGAMSNLVATDTLMTWEVPDDWSLQEAATVPVVYSTCLFAYEVANVKKGHSILIHSGTGGIGQAAISLALYLGCTVYTTVGSREKREFIKERFPQMTDQHIFNSRDTSFEKQIMKETKGKGVDVILNSLAEEKLLASVRCLSRGGRFIEIGKYDLSVNNPINLLLLQKQASFHGVMLDALFEQPYHVKMRFHTTIHQAIAAGAIKPIGKNIFRVDEVEQAFRFMASGKHTGKVLLEIRKEEEEKMAKPKSTSIPGIPRYSCDPDKVYIICGGLGGFGLELADWLTLRGCRNLVLTSRHGVRTGYQAYRISLWKSYMCNVQIYTDDITTADGCRSLLTKANKLGVVHAVFNLAVVLEDSLLENQNVESFATAFGPKAHATEYLDAVTRELCPNLRDFVVFSSVSCGRGNIGQTNYGMANSVMERICEARRCAGYSALAIEWGATGEVGLVAEMLKDNVEMQIGGTLQQRVSSCLEVLDILLHQNDAAIISSMVVAEKKTGTGVGDNVVDAVAHILGIKDLKSISLSATLAEVGMDSMTAVEIKQTLEREFDVFLTAPDIKTMTFGRLQEIQAEKAIESENTSGHKKLWGLDMLIKFVANDETVELSVLPVKGKQSERSDLPVVVLFPGVEGVAHVLSPLYSNLEAEFLALQYPNSRQADTIEEMASGVLPFVEENISTSQPFNIVAYSFGVLVGLQVVHVLEQAGYQGRLICIDGSPELMRKLVQMLDADSDEKLQNSLLIHITMLYLSYDLITKHMETLLKCNTFEEKLELVQNVLGDKSFQSPETLKQSITGVYKRLRAITLFEADFRLKSTVMLFKASHSSIEMNEEDYGLSKICSAPVTVRQFDGNHLTVLENMELARAVQECCSIRPDDVS